MTRVVALLLSLILNFAQGPSLPYPGHGGGTTPPVTFTFQQKVTCNQAVAAQCNFTITTTAGRAGIILTIGSSNHASIVSITTNAGTWNLSPGTCQVVSGVGAWTPDCAWIASETACVACTIGVTMTCASCNYQGVYAEYSYTGGTPTLDAAVGTSVNTSCTSCVGPALTLAGTSDVIVQAVSACTGSGAVSGNAFTTPAWTQSVAGIFFSAGSAVNTSNGGSPTWACSVDTVAMEGLALK